MRSLWTPSLQFKQELARKGTTLYSTKNWSLFAQNKLSTGRASQMKAQPLWSLHAQNLSWKLPARRFSTGTANLKSKSGPSSLWAAVAASSVAFGLLGFYVGHGRITRNELFADSALTAPSDGSNGKYADRDTMARAALQIQQKLGEDAVTFEPDVLEAHSHSEWSTSNSPVRPIAVVYPRSTADCVAIAQICNQNRVPIVPYGAGSSVEGSFCAPHSGITVDFSLMDKILAVHEDDMDVVVQAGVCWTDLNKHLEQAGTGLWLPVDPSPTAQVGGMVATNCSGTNATRYGTMKDWVVNLTVVLADGTIVKTRRRPRKSSAGYDLTRLFVGAEGTLGMVTEATLKLAVIPQATGVATASFPSLEAAASAAVRMMRTGIQLAALEFMDEQQMSVINKNGGTMGADGKTKRLWAEKPTLFLKFSGTETTIQDDAARVKNVVKEFGGSELEFATSEAEKAAIWSARKEALWAMLAQRAPGTEIWSTDVAVPLSRLSEIITLSKQESSQLGLFSSVLGHVGDGNFHQSVMYHPDNPEEMARVKGVVKKMMSRAMDMEGTVSGEHAVGIGKKDELQNEVGAEAIDMMRAIKKAVDPKGVMNPGKVFDLKEDL